MLCNHISILSLISLVVLWPVMYCTDVTFRFLLNQPVFIFQVRSGSPRFDSEEQSFGIGEGKLFIGWMLFLSPNQQC